MLIADIHAHPSLKTYLFKMKFDRKLFNWNIPYKTGGDWNPFYFCTDLHKLEKGKVDILFSSDYLPEKSLINDCSVLKFTGFLGKHFLGERIDSIINEKNSFNATVKIFNHFENELAKSKNKIEIAKNYNDIKRILNDGKKVIVQTLEGGHSLNGKLENVEKLFNRGVCSITLAHFYENEITHTVGGIPEDKKLLGCFQNSKIQTDGLKPFGIEVVHEMFRLGMIVDLSHCTPKAREEIYELNKNYKKPLIFSHVGVQKYNWHPMNPSDKEIKVIAKAGGLIGVIFMNHWLSMYSTKRDNGIEYLAKTIEHLINIGGIDCVAIGTDFDGFTDPPDDLKDISELPKLIQYLSKLNGITENDIEKIMGVNAIRLLKEGWGK
jgi:membrane dipeptidase